MKNFGSIFSTRGSKAGMVSPRRERLTLPSILFALALLGSSMTTAYGQVITQILPSSGPMAGGNVIRLLGSGFTASTGVWIWANQASVLKLVSANELDVIAPARTVAGCVDVVAGTYRVTNGYTYTTTPTPLLTESASSLKFGSITLGNSATQVLTVKSSGTGPVVISGIGLTGSGYSIVGGSLAGIPITSVVYPVTLNVGVQGTITLQFKPTAAGTSNGTFSLYSNSSSGGKLTAALSGTGVAPVGTPHVTVTPASVSFGSVTAGTATSQSLTVSSSGTAPVILSAAAVSGAGYSVSGVTFPLTLAVGQKATLAVQFKPASAGTFAGQVSIASNDPVGAAKATLSGTGTANTAQGKPLNSCGSLTQSGSYYLTQNVTSSGTCFFIDADNISLNLNGYTITYATGGGTAPTPGIVLADPWYTFLSKSGSTYTHNNFEVYGGSITESKTGAAKSAAIWVGQSSGIAFPKVHDLILTTYTQDAMPIYGDITDSGWQIYNNKIYYSSTTTSSRYAFYGVAIWIGNQEQAPGPYTDLIYNNFIYTAPQGGIRDTHQNAKIYGNDITFNSLYTNDFCIDAPADGQQIYSNACHPTSGRGIHTAANNVWVHDNVITVQELKQNAEYGGCELGGAYGIQVEFDNSFTSAPPTGVQIANNQVNAIAGDCNAVGLRLTSMTITGSVAYTSNVVTTTNNGGTGLDYGFSFSADVEGPSRFLFTANTFQSKHAYVTVDWDGANVIVPAGQIWKGTPTYAIDNQNGYNDQAEGGPAFVQAVTLGDAAPGAVQCGPYAAGMQQVGTTSQKCN